MRSCVLLPYCPLPVDTGAKAEMWKHLNILKQLGPCRIASASSRPVGTGWTPEFRETIHRMGFEVVLREDSVKRLTLRQYQGIAYAAVCKALGMNKAFPHGNPYHRHAFPADWWRQICADADIAVLNYSYWAWLPCPCPKILVLLDLWSDYMWGNTTLETREIATCKHVFAISIAEVEKLRARGIPAVSWSPPAIEKSHPPLPANCGFVGSANPFNIEGLRWLERGLAEHQSPPIHVYGALARAIRNNALHAIGRYEAPDTPYHQNGILLFTTTGGTGLQIKTIEALAAGRAIIARRGAMRGIPEGAGAWIEVDSPAEMLETARRLRENESERIALGARAHAYYDRHLNSDQIAEHLRDVLISCSTGPKLTTRPGVPC